MQTLIKKTKVPRNVAGSRHFDKNTQVPRNVAGSGNFDKKKESSEREYLLSSKNSQGGVLPVSGLQAGSARTSKKRSHRAA